MALTVGELQAVLSVDDRAVRPALRRAEQAMRDTAGQMGRDGEDAGQQLGQGLIRGADGQWRNMRGELVDAVTAAAAEAEAQAHEAGRRAAAGFTDGLGEGARQSGDELGDQVRRGGDDAADAANNAGDEAGQGFFSRMRGRAREGVGGVVADLKEGLTSKLGIAALGAAAGAALMAGIGSAMEQGQIKGRLAAQLGATGPEAERYGHVAGKLYASAVTEDFEGAAEAISVVMRAGIAPPGATEAQLQSIATKVHDLATTFDLDLGQTANAVGQMIKTGLAKDGTEAVDALTVGLQKMGPRADDIADTFNEYSTIFRNLGLDATTATGLLSQGMQAGARDTDVVADSLKEFLLTVQGGGKAVDEAFAKIGLNGKAMQKAFAEGGPKASAALDTVLDKLRGIKDPAERNALALALFKTKSEDMQKALFALDPSKATKALGEVGGAADKMGDSLRDNAATRVEVFKRTLQQGIVNFIGDHILPGITGLGGKVGGAFSRLWDEAGKGGEKGADRVVGFVSLVGQKILEKVPELAPKAVEAVSGLGESIASYIMANPMQVLKIALIAAAIIAAIAYLPELIAAGLGATAGLIIAGFVTRLVEGTQEKLPEWWGAFTGWVSQKAGEAGHALDVVGSAIGVWFGGLWSRYVATPVSGVWNSFIGQVKALPGRTTGALSSMGSSLAARASGAWQSFKDSSAAKAAAFIAWVRGLPGRISSGVGSLSGLLVQKGKNVVQGLWNGIQSMGGWIYSKIVGWAKSAIPGPIAKALGIASPSKVTKAQGRWIARGMIDGLTGSTKQVQAASTKLADIVADSMKRGSKRSRALALISTDSKKLTKLASQRERVATRIKDAQKKLDGLIADRDKLAADVKKGVLDSADITKQDTGGWPQTAETILAGLKQDRAAAERFAKNLAALRKKGVRADLIAQIAQAGVEQGSSAAAALANATSAQIKAINAEQGKLVTAAGQAGSSAGDAMYGAGINAAQGLIRGLQSQQKAIDAQMLKIAKSMSASIRKALGIKSPSRVMALVGQYTAQGLIKGVEGQRTAVNRTMSSLVETPAPGSWDMASARARASASQKVVLELHSSGQAEDNYLVERVRRGIRKKGGGDVDLVLAGRRSG
ncbi:phage tail tape measure protein [Streptomyces sp. PD-S100-1]|uniref:phage tail tape measure protein n=1 Tax=Streptomyces sp. PD-S100-1 TaxID=3394351 RepID=UPI0039BC48B0